MEIGNIIKTKKPLRLYYEDEWVTGSWKLIWSEAWYNSETYNVGKIIDMSDGIEAEFDTKKGKRRFLLKEEDINDKYKRKLKIDKLLNDKL